MKKSTRALVGLVAIELALLGGTAWMVMQVKSGAWKAFDEGEAIGRITQTGGGAMGIAAGILLVAFFIHRKNGN